MTEPRPSPATPRPPAPRWLRPAVDYGPLVVFFAGYFQFGLFAATAGLMGATAVALALSFAYERRLPMVPLVTAAVVGVFGGLTLWLHDETFIKIKPTIVQVLFAAVLFGGLLFRRSFLKSLLGTTISMDDRGWHILTVRYAWFFLAMAGLNEGSGGPEHRLLGHLQGLRHRRFDRGVRADPGAGDEPPSRGKGWA